MLASLANMRFPFCQLSLLLTRSLAFERSQFVQSPLIDRKTVIRVAPTHLIVGNILIGGVLGKIQKWALVVTGHGIFEQMH